MHVRGLNQITVRYSYPLPLIATAIELMHGARFFTKLDLRRANNLVDYPMVDYPEGVPGKV